MKQRQTISMLLAALLLVMPLTACSGETTQTEETAGTETAPVQEETTPAETGRSNTKDNIPADFTMNGQTLGVYMRSSVEKNDWDGGGEESGDVIYDAVYKRTRSVEERLNVNFEKTVVEGTWQDFGTGMETNIMAGDNTWQIVLTTGNASIQSSRDFLFQDLSKNKYIDFEQPWWWTDTMRELSVDGKQIKYLVGDIGLTNSTTAGAMYFNQELVESNGVMPEEIYKLVIDRKWTYDKLQEYTEAMYSDLNGDGIVNTGDRYGLLVDNVEFLIQMTYSTDVRMYSRDEQGYPVMDYDTDRAVRAIDTMNTLIYETTGNAFLDAPKVDYTPFVNGKTVFCAYRLGAAISATSGFREMEADYGIIPFPMLDEEQGEYTNLIHNSSNYFTIPVTCPNAEEVGAVLEALCAESYRSVVEPFYETALKAKYSRDSYSGQCIDIIRAVSEKNFLYEYNIVVKGGNMLTEQISKNTNNFASAYASQVNATNKNIQRLLETYE